MAEYDLDEDIQKAAEDMQEALQTLVNEGFTKKQVEHLAKYVAASILRNQCAILKANREIKGESACQPGAFQTKVL
jgi:hypothetical protein